MTAYLDSLHPDATHGACANILRANQRPKFGTWKPNEKQAFEETIRWIRQHGMAMTVGKNVVRFNGEQFRS